MLTRFDISFTYDAGCNIASYDSTNFLHLSVFLFLQILTQNKHHFLH